jgi:hypothetical protein
MADRGLDTRRTTGLAGLLAAILFVVGNALWALDQPDPGASASTIVDFYADASGRIIAGGSLSLLSTAFLVLFASGVRTILRETDGSDLLASTAFGGVLVLVGAGLGAETINMAGAFRAGNGTLTPELGRALFEISSALGYNGAGAGVGILLAATAAVALRAQALMPRWLALVTLGGACVFFTPLARFVVAPSVLVLAAVSARLRWVPARLSSP